MTAPGSKCLRVLAAEDTSSIRLLLDLYIVKAGHRLDMVGDGKAALDKFVLGGYDFVILDIQMPVMDGRESARGMRAWEKAAGRSPTPMLALTANTEEEDLRRCVEAGFSAVLRKPFTRAELAEAMARCAVGAPAAADPEFADLIPRFLDGCREDLAKMRSALARGDYRELSASGHRIVGSGASYGFDAISEAGRLIEKSGKAGDAAGASRGIDDLSRCLDGLMKDGAE